MVRLFVVRLASLGGVCSRLLCVVVSRFVTHTSPRLASQRRGGCTRGTVRSTTSTPLGDQPRFSRLARYGRRRPKRAARDRQGALASLRADSKTVLEDAAAQLARVAVARDVLGGAATGALAVDRAAAAAAVERTVVGAAARRATTAGDALGGARRA